MGLHGKRVLVTRAAHQAESLVRLLTERGAQALRYPCIAIAPPQDTTELDAIILDAARFDWLILTSTNTVHMLKQRADALGVGAVWSDVRVAAVGPKTAKAAADLLNINVDCVPDEHTADALAATLLFNNRAKVVLPQSELADNTLAHNLTQSGADVTALTAYRNTIGAGGDAIAGTVDALTFTSGSTVQNLITRWQAEGRDVASLFDLPAACIGPVTGDVAAECGFQQIVIPDTYTAAMMVAALDHFFVTETVNE